MASGFIVLFKGLLGGVLVVLPCFIVVLECIIDHLLFDGIVNRFYGFSGTWWLQRLLKWL